MPTTRTLTPLMPGRVKFATSTAPRPPLADLVSNLTPPGQISREWELRVIGQLAREIGWPGLYNLSGLILEGACSAYPHIRHHCVKI
jgi:hypothetical protein